MLIRIGYDIELAVATPMAIIYLLRVHPSRRDDLLAPETVTVSGGLIPEEYVDSFGNHCGRVNVPVGMQTVRITNEAIVRDPGELDIEGTEARQHDPTELPSSTLQFLLPSRYCEVDSELLQFAWNQFGQTPMGWARVQAICEFTYDRITFGYEYARPDKTARNAYDERRGVCRDFAHLAITLCRAVGIPARYISAYAWQLQPPDFHAVFEAYLASPGGGGAWYLFDPTRMAALDGLVRIGAGRDAADVAFCSIYGATKAEAPRVWITGPAPGPLRTTMAVSTQAA